jgi:hypothetical protein
VQPHIAELIRLWEEGLVASIGYPVNNSPEVLTDSTWADLIEGPLSGLEGLRDFNGTLAIHGVFRSHASDERLLESLASRKAVRVVLILGTWRLWRLLENWI